MAYSNITCTLQLSRKNQKIDENKFEAIMMEAIDESLNSFENLDKQEVYLHLENSFNIRKQELPHKIEKFAEAMEQMFGIGAKLIEIRIIETLHTKMPEFMYTPRMGVVLFKKYVANLRTFLLQSA